MIHVLTQPAFDYVYDTSSFFFSFHAIMAITLEL